uniref:Uncharacterized protein n=1 Tax=Hippocampus comes TaxID=109280 RepID=A0A3Q2XP61_HIPCM
MPSLLFCGPKMAACGMVISIWGVIMLVREQEVLIYGAQTEQNHQKQSRRLFPSSQVGINCFSAAAVYVAVGAVSLCQVRLNKRQEYMVT